ncbi:MAG: hypothetical protein R3B13_22025 [Polyangiaceae bacterium]
MLQTRTKPASDDNGRAEAIYACAPVSRAGGEATRAHRKKACDEAAWAATWETKACRDPEGINAISDCQRATAAREAAKWACGKQAN